MVSFRDSEYTQSHSNTDQYHSREGEHTEGDIGLGGTQYYQSEESTL